MRPRRVPLGEDDALEVRVGVLALTEQRWAVVLTDGPGGSALRPVLTRYFEHVANQLRWQLPWLVPGNAGSAPAQWVWYQWQPARLRAGTEWPARLSRVVLAEHQGVYRYASWREADEPWEVPLIEVLSRQGSPVKTRP